VHGLHVNHADFDQVLKPLAGFLDACWWNLGGAGMHFPSIRPAARLKGSRINEFDPDDLKRYIAEQREASAEYDKWVDNSTTDRVGIPGFFSRYAPGIEGNWKTYYVSDAVNLPAESFALARKTFDGNWFDWPPEVPKEICLITRDIDAAYLDLFFRDEWMYRSVFDYLRGRAIGVRDYVPYDVTQHQRRR
jgi:hypothetical protein